MATRRARTFPSLPSSERTMDRSMLVLLIPILALSIPVLAIFFNGMVKLAQTRALGAGEHEIVTRLGALENELAEVRHQLVETQERLDFAERLLVQPPARSDAP
jgi:hypothetical protein